jgi:hypothetical protein
VTPTSTNTPPYYSVAFDAANTGGITGSGSLALTVGNQSNRLLVAQVVISDGITGVTAIDYNGVDMSTGLVANDAWGTSMTARTYILVAPAVGNHNLNITVSPANSVNVAVSSYFNVNQSSPTAGQNTATSAGPVASLDAQLPTAANGSMAISLFFSPDGASVPSVNTLFGCLPVSNRWSSAVGLYAQGDDQSTCGAGTYDFNYTATGGNQSMGAQMVEIVPIP